MFKICIAGSRNFTDYTVMKLKLDHLLQHRARKDQITVISGTCRGADQLGERYAQEKGYDLIRMPADWHKFGKSAGYKRNYQMAEMADAVAIFWDGQSKGSKHMFNICNELNVSCSLYEYKPQANYPLFPFSELELKGFVRTEKMQPLPIVPIVRETYFIDDSVGWTQDSIKWKLHTEDYHD